MGRLCDSAKMRGAVLHVLNGERGLDTYPSVYNAMYVLDAHGWNNQIITGGSVDGFDSVIKNEFRFRGGYLRRAMQLARLTGDFDQVILYEPRDVEIFQLSRLLGGRLRYKTLVHHSLEIPTEILQRQGVKSFVHRFLYRGYRKVGKLIIQDGARQALFYKCFARLKDVPCFLVPNSYIPDLEPVAESVPWFERIVESGKPIVTYTGAVERWALSADLFLSIRDMTDVNFVFSGWSYDGFAQEAMALCDGVQNIYFDLGMKSRGALNYIVKNSDLGLVFYDSADPNVAVIGLSSGKLHKFLSYGKPVVVNEIPSMRNFLENNRFGIATTSSDIPVAIRTILSSYEIYSNGVSERYGPLIDFRAAYERSLGITGN